MTYLLCGSIIFLTHFLISRYWKKIRLSFGKLLGLTILLLLAAAFISTAVGTLLPIVLSTLITAVILQNAYLQNIKSKS
ncbi:hypothetical protein I6N96_19180 [Enterococcus sp. BWM-S5]|uniref:Uncharacterized protein n=1 Tax=Enterococcus larvae TaxID=2794352 RepID=A0ABS4CPB6_9ENTE|nr:hypothetical protein [Enterococcus larvae]MBP1048408.1 hypothetical protein [Enterococcus larvae]